MTNHLLVQHECISEMQWHDIHIRHKDAYALGLITLLISLELPSIIQLAQLRYAA